jgi:hypothetical protein
MSFAARLQMLPPKDDRGTGEIAMIGHSDLPPPRIKLLLLLLRLSAVRVLVSVLMLSARAAVPSLAALTGHALVGKRDRRSMHAEH